MSNRKFKIIHWDDDSVMKGFITGTIPSVLKEFECEVEQGDFFDSSVQFVERLKNVKYDLVILDIENETDKDNKSDVGFELLNDVITTYKNSIPLLIFSRHPRVLEKVGEFKKAHNLNIEFLNKGLRGEPAYQQRVKEKLKLLLNLGYPEVKLLPYNDFKTKSAVKSIGLHNLQSIISLYLSSKSILSNDKVSIKVIAPGYSGAYVFEVVFGSLSKLLKISHDKSVIVREYENLNSYSTFLPSKIKIDYDKIDPTQLSSEGWYPIFYELVSYSNTLFGFIAKNQNQHSEIEALLAEIFSDERFLKLYQHRKEFDIVINKNILEDIDSVRASFIENAVKTLEPILKKHSNIFDKSIIDIITEHHSFGNISDAKIGIPKSNKILSHADLHADNILVDSQKSPIVIDPGSINYKYWSYDINRLLMDLFIRGIGHQTLDYFDINSIKKDYSIFQNILTRQAIQVENFKSDEGFITAINWLIKNVTEIHKTDFVEWQYQLGLGLELLKASYKSISLPANKRALALLCACEAIKKASATLETTT
ncbi:MAG: hypothetical protein A3G23_08550 [Bacteroidetes bacterium RIFCSPLOWO2_12_FULL_37_12]|nr:MAG: hypothetical protein A3G23_08550 [Bacteroidetes bacterium RIFCSPLOWO2_12_FULL_37_12]